MQSDKASLKKTDQPPHATRPEDLVKYLYVELYVKRENHVKFEAEMTKLVDIMFDYKRWELVFASYPITGDLNHFVHIWKIPDESTVVDVMRAGALGNVYIDADDPAEATLQRELNDAREAAKSKETPEQLKLIHNLYDRVHTKIDKIIEKEFRECYLSVQNLIESTRHELLTALPYDPTHVGYQTQTILIDTKGKPFVIEHEDLRKHAQNDIASKLEELARSRPKIRAAGHRGNRTQREGCSPDHALIQERFKEQHSRLNKIQDHLNRGSMVAKIGEGKDLLFNLAALKPRSVYQNVTTATEIADRGGSANNDKNQRNPDEPTLPGTKLLIATPWGSVYDLGSQDVRNLLKRPSPKDIEKVNEALKPILEGDAPLAAIPEERDKIIGDGCACYVINLSSSFVPKT